MDEVNGGGLPPDHPGTFPDDPHGPAPAVILPPTALVKTGGGGGMPPAPPPPDDDEEDEDERGMLRMSFLEHLEELRDRIIKALWGFGVIFFLCVCFSNQLFNIIIAPGFDALKRTGIPGAEFTVIDPMEGFSIIWVWTPLVASIFFGAPWILWQ